MDILCWLHKHVSVYTFFGRCSYTLCRYEFHGAVLYNICIATSPSFALIDGCLGVVTCVQRACIWFRGKRLIWGKVEKYYLWTSQSCFHIGYSDLIFLQDSCYTFWDKLQCLLCTLRKVNLCIKGVKGGSTNKLVTSRDSWKERTPFHNVGEASVNILLREGPCSTCVRYNNTVFHMSHL